MSEINLLLQNAELRDQMEPFLDESVYLLRPERMSVRCENELLESLLTWERAPVLPIAQWFEPELVLPEHHELDDSQLKQQLHQVIGRLFEKNIVLEMTDHLPDRQLYCLIVRDILPSEEKKITLKGNVIRMQCLDIVDDEESWLRYYATQQQRQTWSFENGHDLPPRESLPFPRSMPQL